MEILGLDDSQPAHQALEWRQRVHPEQLTHRLDALRAYLDGAGAEYRIELQLMARDGGWRWILERGTVVSRTPGGEPLRMIGTCTDITGQKAAEAELLSLATTDPLTGMYNRRHLLERLDEAWAVSQRLPDHPVSVLLLDIDHFKQVNDAHGHQVGDEVLKHCAALINAGLRKSDTAGRLGGEEFVIVLRGADVLAARSFAQRLRKRVADTPLHIGGQRVGVTVSIGVSGVTPDDANGLPVLKRADEAMYVAKQAGRNRVHVDAKAAAELACAAAAGGRFVRLVWRKVYECGHPEIDRQHKEMFDISNRLLNAIVDESPGDELQPTLRQLLAVVVEHFRDEEELLQAAGYAGLEHHIGLHHKLEAQAAELSAKFAAGGAPIGDAFVFIARDVVGRHMLIEDRKFFDLTRAHGVQLSGSGELLPH